MFRIVKQTQTAGHPTAHKSLGSARTLLRAAALAVVLVSFGAGSAEASPITCGFGTNASGGCLGSPTEREFNFGPYQLVLDFAFFGGSVIGGFDVTFNDDLTDQSEVGGRFVSPDTTCVPINGLGPGQNCVEFQMASPLPVQGVNFVGDYRIDVIWAAPTDVLFPDAPSGRIRLVHDSSLTPGNTFASDITIPGSYFVLPPVCEECEFPGDPGIGGRDTNFENFMVVHVAAVPEPTTLVLLATGLGGFLYRRRRQRQAADTLPRS